MVPAIIVNIIFILLSFVDTSIETQEVKEVKEVEITQLEHPVSDESIGTKLPLRPEEDKPLYVKVIPFVKFLLQLFSDYSGILSTLFVLLLTPEVLKAICSSDRIVTDLNGVDPNKRVFAEVAIVLLMAFMLKVFLTLFFPFLNYLFK